MTFESIEYLVADLPTAPQTLTVEASGRADYVSHTNEATLDRPEIGAYQTTLPQDQVQTLDALLTKPPFADLPDHWGRVKSGERYRRIRVRTGAQTCEKMVGSREPVDPRLGKIIDQLDAIAKEVSKHPAQVVEVGNLQATVAPEGDLIVTLSLRNGGTQPAYWRNPEDLLSEQNGRIAIELWPDKPPAQLSAEMLVSLDVRKAEQVRAEGGARAGKTVLEIPPDGSLSYKLHAAIGTKAGGAYVLRVACSNTLGESSGRHLVVGQLMSKTIRVLIPSRAAAGR